MAVQIIKTQNVDLSAKNKRSFNTKEIKNSTNILKQLILEKIKLNGGFVNTHSHLDRAFTITPETLHLANASLKEKWFLVDSIKRNSSVNQIYDRMSYAIEKMLAQNVQAIGTFIDVDEVVGDKCIQAAQMLKDSIGSDIKLKFINQTLKGVIDPKSRKWFELGSEFVDIIGGLPAKDAGHEDEHLNILMETAKRLNKPVHVHVDQFNTAGEKETEQLADKTIEYGMQGKISAIHCISVGSHQLAYRQQLYKKIVEAGLNVITCPTAWIDSKRSEELAPIHNSIAPVEEMIPVGINVAIGTDNIADLLKPFTSGNMWTELRFLLESCRYYEIDELVKISTTNGLKVLDIN